MRKKRLAPHPTEISLKFDLIPGSNKHSIKTYKVLINLKYSNTSSSFDFHTNLYHDKL